jgi:hypothetical protein
VIQEMEAVQQAASVTVLDLWVESGVEELQHAGRIALPDAAEEFPPLLPQCFGQPAFAGRPRLLHGETSHDRAAKRRQRPFAALFAPGMGNLEKAAGVVHLVPLAVAPNPDRCG